MDSWERFNEIIVSNKNAFYSKINLQGITNEDYIHAQKVFKELKKKKLRGISWFICSKWYIIDYRCIWKL